MATTPNSAATTLHFLRGLLTPNSPTLTDAELLQAFASKGDEAAFNTLVKRHGPLVLGVCRRLLGPGPDAEDAFQATFLLLVRKARSIRRLSSLAAWLHGTARRIALCLRRTGARRRKREAAATPASYQSPAAELTWREVQAALDEEIARLAEKYRSVFVLCCLEHKSLREAAGCLGLKEGTVGSRLDRARKDLRQRLTRRGIDLSALLATVALAQPSAAVALPLVQATVRAGCLIGSGQAAAGAVSAKVLGLVHAGTRSMPLGKIAFVSLAVVAAGTISAQRVCSGQPGRSRDLRTMIRLLRLSTRISRQPPQPLAPTITVIRCPKEPSPGLAPHAFGMRVRPALWFSPPMERCWRPKAGREAFSSGRLGPAGCFVA
jgi:RNA polymerase sigma factor (sigma-70 family)